MRRMLWFVTLFALMLQIIPAPPAGAEAVNTKTAYEIAITYLRRPDNPEDVQEALKYLNSSHLYDSYENVSFLRLYAEALSFVHEQNYGEARMNLELLREIHGYADFQAFLEANSLISVDDLYQYAHARECEDAGVYANAVKLYKQYPVMDSISRLTNLNRNVFPEALARAEALYQSGRYADAMNIALQLSGAGYKPAANLLTKCQAALATPTPKPTKTPTPKPTKTPTPKPTKTPTPKPTKTPTPRPTSTPTPSPRLSNLTVQVDADSVTLNWDDSASYSRTYYCSILIRDNYWYYWGNTESTRLTIPYLMLNENYTFNIATSYSLLNSTTATNDRLVVRAKTPAMQKYTVRNFRSAQMEFAFGSQGTDYYTSDRTTYTTISQNRLNGYSDTYDFFAVLYQTYNTAKEDTDHHYSWILTTPDKRIYYERSTYGTDKSYQSVWCWLPLDILIEQLDEDTSEFPVGTYKVEIYIDGRYIISKTFKLVAS